MRYTGYVAAVFFAAATFASGPAFANTCEADNLTCPTTMPVGGYCQCTAHGVTKDGTVVSKSTRHQRVNATAGGCGAEPNSPGCH